MVAYGAWNVVFDGIPGSEFGLNDDVDDAEPLGVFVWFVLIGTINVSAARLDSEIILIFSLIDCFRLVWSQRSNAMFIYLQLFLLFASFFLLENLLNQMEDTENWLLSIKMFSYTIETLGDIKLT